MTRHVPAHRLVACLYPEARIYTVRRHTYKTDRTGETKVVKWTTISPVEKEHQTKMVDMTGRKFKFFELKTDDAFQYALTHKGHIVDHSYIVCDDAGDRLVTVVYADPKSPSEMRALRAYKGTDWVVV